MPTYVLTFNKNGGNFTNEEIREELIIFLYENRAIDIKQCLETTFTFKGGVNTARWKRLITDILCAQGNIFENCNYLFTRVFYTHAGGYEVFQKCNPELQVYVDEQIEKLNKPIN